MPYAEHTQRSQHPTQPQNADGKVFSRLVCGKTTLPAATSAGVTAQFPKVADDRMAHKPAICTDTPALSRRNDRHIKRNCSFINA
jgi:hypothetical protein